jgi:tRNA nucleotidyltransferase/poly(A) polymerase
LKNRLLRQLRTSIFRLPSYENQFSSKYGKLFKIISKVAQEKNQTVYIVGGYVRDLLMQRKAPTDIDFVTEQRNRTAKP